MSAIFPYSVIRPGQDLLINDLQAAFENKKILLANAPTGLGKTVSALAAALPIAAKNNLKIFFLTNRHTQHQIAIETLKAINKNKQQNFSCADLIGKRWMCNQEIANLFGTDFNEYCRAVVEKGECEFYSRVRDNKGLQPEAKLLLKKLEQAGPLHNEELIKRCQEEKMCSYEMALALAKNARVILADYYYIFNPHIQTMILHKLDLKLEQLILIVDEGHNLPRRLTEMLSSKLSTIMLRNALIEAKKFNYKGIIIWLQELVRILQDLMEGGFENREKLIAKEEFVKRVQSIVNYDDLIDEIEEAAEEIHKKQQRSYLSGIAAFLSSWKGEENSYVRILNETRSKYGPVTTLNYSCLDPQLAAKEILSQVHSGVLMSGTLTPTFMYRDLLGIDKAIEKNYASPFPPENRLALIIPETSTKFTLRTETMYQNIAAKCSELAALIPGNVAFFFPSYELRDRIGTFFKSQKRVFWEKSEMDKEEKEHFLAEFKAGKNQGGVLLGVIAANFAEGIDLPGDLLNGVIIVGLPLERPNLKTNKMIQYYDQKFGRGWDYGYIFPAMNKCLQSAGRCIRSETDRGAIIFLEERFAWDKYYSCLPKEGLIISKNYSKLLKKFFQSPL